MARNALYAAVWRWHFYAGRMTLPFLVLLAVMGALYLFRDEISDWRYDALLRVALVDGANLAVRNCGECGEYQWLMLLVCVAILVMCISAVCMWWIRRPQGSLGAPRLPDGCRTPRGFLLILVLSGLVFPLVGASIVVVLMVDALFAGPLATRFCRVKARSATISRVDGVMKPQYPATAGVPAPFTGAGA